MFALYNFCDFILQRNEFRNYISDGCYHKMMKQQMWLNVMWFQRLLTA